MPRSPEPHTPEPESFATGGPGNSVTALHPLTLWQSAPTPAPPPKALRVSALCAPHPCPGALAQPWSPPIASVSLHPRAPRFLLHVWWPLSGLLLHLLPQSPPHTPGLSLAPGFIYSCAPFTSRSPGVLQAPESNCLQAPSAPRCPPALQSTLPPATSVSAVQPRQRLGGHVASSSSLGCDSQSPGMCFASRCPPAAPSLQPYSLLSCRSWPPNLPTPPQPCLSLPTGCRRPFLERTN